MDTTSVIITIISILITVVSIFLVIYDKTGSINEIRERWKLRHLRKIFNFKNGEKVIVVCSELPVEDGGQQILEKREYIYYRKYGDLDALFECLLSMIKNFPKVNFEIRTSSENITNLDAHIIVIGGPDYNMQAKNIIKDRDSSTRFDYSEIDDEIVIIDRNDKNKTPYYFPTKSECEAEDEDYGYIEKIPNPNLECKSKSIFLFGGCHTIGVTGAVKYFSVFSNGTFNISKIVLNRARSIVKDKSIDKNKFALLFRVKRIGTNIDIPRLVKDDKT
jgi:hypothetical protein